MRIIFVFQNKYKNKHKKSNKRNKMSYHWSMNFFQCNDVWWIDSFHLHYLIISDLKPYEKEKEKLQRIFKDILPFFNYFRINFLDINIPSYCTSNPGNPHFHRFHLIDTVNHPKFDLFLVLHSNIGCRGTSPYKQG